MGLHPAQDVDPKQPRHRLPVRVRVQDRETRVTVYYFPAFVQQRDRGYQIAFPDLPDCTTLGATIQEVMSNAENALTGHLAVLRERGLDIPQPAELDTIERDPEVPEVVRVLVRAELPDRKVAVRLMMDETVLMAIDAVSPNRSSFLENAARDLLRRRPKV
jgi:predicted RNase H-like HicB family nuclease